MSPGIIDEDKTSEEGETKAMVLWEDQLRRLQVSLELKRN
jgi:hypothetical protein